MCTTCRDMQPFEYCSVRYWSKEINGTRTGGRKRKFFNSRTRPQGGRAGGNLSIRGPEVALGSHRVGTIHVQSPTPHAWALPSVDTYRATLSASHLAWPVSPKFCFQSPMGSPSADVCGAGAYPIPSLPREASRGRSAPTKIVLFGPDGAPFP